MEEIKSHLRADYKKKLYDALIESYNTDKDVFNTYDEVFTLNRSRDERDKDQDPFVGSNRGTKKGNQEKKPSHPQIHEEPSHRLDDSGVQQNQEFVTGGDLSKRYSTLVTKTKAATYEIKWIENLVRNLWIHVKVIYDKLAYWGTSHWGPKRQHFYGFPANLSSSKDVYYSKRIIEVIRLSIMKKYDYGHLEEIEVYREDQKLYKFREGDFLRLRLQDIDDMLLLPVQKKLTNLTINEWSNLKNKTTYTTYSDPKGVIYKDQMNRNRLMRADELHKFSDGTLDDVWSALNNIANGIRMEYLPKRK
uniref:Uncharacterized protein n=1 Tax=Tanacetum cinerariifolium TaxID=118510 RepID=A0A699IYT4_TANCI|nr:hypothetical protein [Tanacetum cinerariifolium]